MVGRKLTEQETAELETRKTGTTSRLAKQEVYDALLVDFTAGDYGEVTLGEDEKKGTVRKNLNAAAARKGVTLEWHRSKGDTLRFLITE